MKGNNSSGLHDIFTKKFHPLVFIQVINVFVFLRKLEFQLEFNFLIANSWPTLQTFNQEAFSFLTN